MTSTVFLDTTVFADRIFGRRELRREIDALLFGKRVVSSLYVREQFRATFLRAAVLVYNNLRETRDPWEVIRRTDHYRPHSRCFRMIMGRLLTSPCPGSRGSSSAGGSASWRGCLVVVGSGPELHFQTSERRHT
jgi:hypothetical protein